MTDLVKKASVQLGFELVRSLREGDGCPVEADSRLNEASRDIIYKMSEKHNGVYLGRFNPQSWQKDSDLLWKWEGTPVCNFEADFVIPFYDGKLARLMATRLNEVYLGTKHDSVQITAIQARIRELGGEILVWS
jgi:hypothetical protein